MEKKMLKAVSSFKKRKKKERQRKGKIYLGLPDMIAIG